MKLANISRSDAARRAWETIRARRASGYYGKPKAQREKCRTIHTPAPEPEMKLSGRLQLVQLYLLTASTAPVTGLTWYLVLSRSRDGKTVTLFHPWTLTKFDLPTVLFQPLHTDCTITMAQLARCIDQMIAREVSLKREVFKYVRTIADHVRRQAGA